MSEEVMANLAEDDPSGSAVIETGASEPDAPCAEKAEDTEEARGEVKRCLECDLLIIDDLGTEMTTTFTISALYEIINTRLVTGRKTIVSSNLTLQELRQRYPEQIMSRLEGEYQVLTFRGDDIRRKRNVV